MFFRTVFKDFILAVYDLIMLRSLLVRDLKLKDILGDDQSPARSISCLVDLFVQCVICHVEKLLEELKTTAVRPAKSHEF